MAGHRPAVAVAEQTEPLVDVTEDLGRAERPHAGRRELDRERHAVEAAHDVLHREPDAVIEPDRCIGGERTVGEQEHRRRRGAVDVEWRHRQAVLALQCERLAARREDAHARRGTEQRVHQPGDPVEHVLAVVEQQQHRAVAEVVDDPGLGVLVRIHRELDAAHERGDDLGIRRRDGEVDEEDPVGEVRELAAGGLDRHPGLPRAPRSDERDERVRREELVDAGDQLRPADERGALRGQRGAVAAHRAEGREVERQRRTGHLEQAALTVEVAAGGARPGRRASCG